MAALFLVAGFLLAVVGVALVSIPAACIVAGTMLFISGGLELRRANPRQGRSS